MDVTTGRPPTTGELLGDGWRSLIRPPFALLLVVSLLVGAVSTGLPAEDDAGLLGLVLLLLVSAYVQISVILAAAADDPGRSADPWIRAAFRRRCFWRFAATSLMAFVLVGLGLLGAVVGAFFVGALVSLAQPIAVLERVMPGEALRRSALLSRPARVPLGVVYGLLFIVPSVAAQAGYITEVDEALGDWWLPISLLPVPLSVAGQIALTRAYLRLSESGDEPPATPDA